MSNAYHSTVHLRKASQQSSNGTKHTSLSVPIPAEARNNEKIDADAEYEEEIKFFMGGIIIQIQLIRRPGVHK